MEELHFISGTASFTENSVSGFTTKFSAYLDKALCLQGEL